VLRMLLILSIVVVGGSAASALTLVRDGKPAATIILGEKPNRAAQFAAYELQWHVQQMTGATLPIVHENEPASGVRVLVGDSEATRHLDSTTRNSPTRSMPSAFCPAPSC